MHHVNALMSGFTSPINARDGTGSEYPGSYAITASSCLVVKLWNNALYESLRLEFAWMKLFLIDLVILCPPTPGISHET